MRVSVYFYGSIDKESIVWRSLHKLYSSHEHYYRIGGAGGFGVEHLSWHEATLLTAKIAVIIHKTRCVGEFNEFRLLMQDDVENSDPITSAIRGKNISQ